MSVIDQELERTYQYGNPVAMNEDRALMTFGERLVRQNQLLGTPMRQPAVEYLSSVRFLRDAAMAMDSMEDAFEPTSSDRLFVWAGTCGG